MYQSLIISPNPELCYCLHVAFAICYCLEFWLLQDLRYAGFSANDESSDASYSMIILVMSKLIMFSKVSSIFECTPLEESLWIETPQLSTCMRRQMVNHCQTIVFLNFWLYNLKLNSVAVKITQAYSHVLFTSIAFNSTKAIYIIAWLDNQLFNTY